MGDRYILGLNIGKIDPSATLFLGPNIIAHVEEERFTRVKKGVGQFPIASIKYCLSLVEGGLDNIASINLGFDFSKFTLDVPKYYIQEWAAYPKKPAEAANYEINRLNEKNPENIRKKIIKELSNAGLVNTKVPSINWYTHHYCHALSAHLASPFKNSLGIVVDANSEIDTISVWDCNGKNIEKIYSKPLPHSLGWLYRSFTLFCGFDAYEGEGMLMGLAPYGKFDSSLKNKVKSIIKWHEDHNGDFDFDIDPEYIYLDRRSSVDDRLTEKLINAFGNPCPRNVETPDQYYKNVAYAIQDHFEQTLVNFVNRFLVQTKHKYVTLSGGVFLNCKINGRIWSEIDSIEDIYIISTSSDDGIGIGANMANSVKYDSYEYSDYVMNNVYLGPKYSNKEIKETISKFNIRRKLKNDIQYTALSNTLSINNITSKNADNKVINLAVSNYLDKNCTFVEDVAKYAAYKIYKGKVVAWFQGRMEAGPRALGNRSILADPRKIESLTKVNIKVKFRQAWRPFCPSVMDDYKELYFEKPTQSPYMINTFKTTQLARETAPAIVHVDGTARPQFLKKKHNPLFYKLLEQFYKLSNVPILMNTSMNIKGEPMCCTPEDALNFYFSTDVDILIIGNYVFEK